MLPKQDRGTFRKNLQNIFNKLPPQTVCTYLMILSRRGYLVTRIKHKFSKNGWVELKFLLPSIILHLSSLKFGTVGLDRLCIG